MNAVALQMLRRVDAGWSPIAVGRDQRARRDKLASLIDGGFLVWIAGSAYSLTDAGRAAIQ